MDMAAEIGIEMLTEKEYREFQKLGEFDTKTSSWVKTPPDIRKLGGTLFCGSPLQHSLRVSQRCGILLRGQGVPWLAKGLNLDFEFNPRIDSADDIKTGNKRIKLLLS